MTSLKQSIFPDALPKKIPKNMSGKMDTAKQPAMNLLKTLTNQQINSLII